MEILGIGGLAVSRKKQISHVFYGSDCEDMLELVSNTWIYWVAETG